MKRSIHQLRRRMPLTSVTGRNAAFFVWGLGTGVPSPVIQSPCGEPFFCEERLNLARKGLCDAPNARWLLSAMVSKVYVSRALLSPRYSCLTLDPSRVGLRRHPQFAPMKGSVPIYSSIT